MKDVADRSGGAHSAARFRHGLVVAQLAVATTLLAVGGLFILNRHNVERVDPGFRTDDVATFLVRPELNGYGPVRSWAVYERIRERLSAQPGVISVTAASRLLLDGGPGAPAEVKVEGVEAGPDTDLGTLLSTVAQFGESDTARSTGAGVAAAPWQGLSAGAPAADVLPLDRADMPQQIGVEREVRHRSQP